MKQSTKHGASGLQDEDGTISSQSLLEIPVNLIWRCQPLEKLVPLYGGQPRVITSSGRSYTLAELCMCTDYSRPLTGQIGLSLDELPTSSGATCLNASGEVKCVVCKKMRPYALTSVSM